MAFLFAAKKPFARNTVAAHLIDDWFGRCLPCLRATGKILLEHLNEDSNLEAQTRTRAHGR